MDISASRLDHFIPAETAPGTLWIEERVGSRSCLNALEKSKALCSFQDSTHDCSVVSPKRRYCTHQSLTIGSSSKTCQNYFYNGILPSSLWGGNGIFI